MLSDQELVTFFEAAIKTCMQGGREKDSVIEEEKFIKFITDLCAKMANPRTKETRYRNAEPSQKELPYSALIRTIFIDSDLNLTTSAQHFKKLTLYSFALAIKKWRDQNPKPWFCGTTKYLADNDSLNVSAFVKSQQADKLTLHQIAGIFQWALPIINTNTQNQDLYDIESYRELWRNIENLSPIYLKNVRVNFFEVLSKRNRDQFDDPLIIRRIEEMAEKLAENPLTQSLWLRYKTINGKLGILVPIILMALIIAYVMALFIPAVLDRNQINKNASFGEPEVSLWQVIEENMLYIAPLYMKVILGLAGVFFLLFIYLVSKASDCFFNEYAHYEILP